jgi:hypothetical protein
MKHRVTYTVGLIALGMAGFAVSPADADTVAAGPYYATPSWDQTLPVATRFIVLSNFNSEAVLDRETGLVWQRSPNYSTVQLYSNAVFGCATANTGGRQGWRVPHLSELESLMDASATSQPTFPPGHPFTGFPTGSSEFFTDTGVAGQTGRHYCPGYGRRISDGSVTQVFADCIDDTSTAYVFCVRGPGPSGP